jgi:predicted transcriptional regulator
MEQKRNWRDENRMIRTLQSVIKYTLLALIAAICVYAMLNTLTLVLWGDPSIRGVPRIFHPPQIIILHYARLISPFLGKCAELAIFLGIEIIIYVGCRRLTGKNLLDNPVRKDIVRFIQMHPGQHFRSIVRGTGINRGTLYYHLIHLKSLRVVTDQKDGGLTRYFVRLNGISPLERKIISHSDNLIRDRIMTVLKDCPAIVKADLREVIGISGPSLWYHIRLLTTDGIVSPEQDGRRIRYSLTPDAAEIVRSECPGSRYLDPYQVSPFSRQAGGPGPSDDTNVKV